MGIHKSECHGVYVSVKGSLLPSLVGSLESFRGFVLSGFVGRLGKSLSIRYFEVWLGLLVQDIQSSHGFDGRVDPFDEWEGLAAGSIVLFEVEVSSTDLLLASIFYGHQNLSRQFLLFEDLFFGLVEVSFSIFCVGRDGRGVDWLHWLYSYSFFFQDDSL